MKETLLELKGLETQFFTYDGVVKALNKVDLVIYKEETLGIVGETGCGKSVTALSILRLIAPPGWNESICNTQVFTSQRDLYPSYAKTLL